MNSFRIDGGAIGPALSETMIAGNMAQVLKDIRRDQPGAGRWRRAAPAVDPHRQPALLPISQEAPAEGCITSEARGPLLLVGINRPAKFNGFTLRMFRELGEAYTRLDDDPQLRVGVLHAFGKHFREGRGAKPARGVRSFVEKRPARFTGR